MRNITPKAKIKKEADRLWYYKYLQPNCEVCGEPAIQVHHFYYKSSYGHLRYDKDNGISLCKKCHFLLHSQDPKKITNKIIAIRGNRWHNRLTKKSREPIKSGYLTLNYYYDIIKKLK